MYTEDEMKEKIRKGYVCSYIEQFLNGYIIINTGYTYNYYIKKNDNLWYNIDCKTMY